MVCEVSAKMSLFAERLSSDRKICLTLLLTAPWHMFFTYRYFTIVRTSVNIVCEFFVTVCQNSATKTWWIRTTWPYALVQRCYQFRQTATQSSISHTSLKSSAISSVTRMRYSVDLTHCRITIPSMNVALLKTTGLLICFNWCQLLC